MNDFKDKLVYLLQKGLPLESRPFSVLATELGVPESEVIKEVKDLQKSGLIRRFGGVFNSASLGFKSCLCAVSVPEKDIERINGLIIPNLGVTHCYIRDDKLNFWFTFTSREDDYESGLAEFRKKLDPFKLLVLPAVKRFKIQVIFDKTGSEKSDLKKTKTSGVIDLSEKEKKAVSYLQGNIPIKADLYKEIAKELKYTEEDLLELLNKWHGQGALKRLSAIIRHQKFGFKGNGMCVWKVPEEKIQEIGEKLAEESAVSHCYQREMYPEFPYNLYAMIHGETEDDVLRKFNSISEDLELGEGRLLFSRRELKKTSPVYFKPKMQFSVYIMSLIVALLVTAAFPRWGAEEIYKSAFMIILLGLLALLTLLCCAKHSLSTVIGFFKGEKFRFKFRKLGFYLSHLGVVIILVGACLSYTKSEKVGFAAGVGRQYVMDKLVDPRKPDVVVNLDYSFYITDFKVEKFDPFFSLFERDDTAPDGFRFKKRYKVRDGKILLDDGLGALDESKLKDPAGNWVPHVLIGQDYILQKEKPRDKWYSANFNIVDGDIKKQFVLEVNSPVSYKKWRFYLMSYGRDRYGEYLVITARKDPGRIPVISGIWMLIIGIFMICFLRKK